MMTHSPDILFTTEYIKNVLYFATVRPCKILKSTADVHYFCIDNELVYENYYSDFGPLNLGCVYKYCKILNEKLKLYLNKQSIVHYTSIDPKKKANAAFLIGCYGVLYLSLSPKDALKPLYVHGQSYRAFQDATQGDPKYTISLMDCLCAIKKARELDFFNFQDFNLEEYERLDKVQGGDLNWIVPGKFLAFIGPVEINVSLYHPPEMYIDYFKESGVKIVIRLNKRMYDGNVFNKAGILHYDLFFQDGSCPPRHILMKFLQIAEDSNGAIAVHCKAGLGRTGSLIGCYLIKHYRMSAHEAIGWMRICRPGSVIGHQQEWLEQIENWMIKQGNFYRKRTFQDTEKFPIHEFGIYSIAEKMLRQRPVVMSKSPSPPPPIQRQTRSDTTPPVRPQASKYREDQEDQETVMSTTDLTKKSTVELSMLKGCEKNICIHESYDHDDPYLRELQIPFWKKYFCCQGCGDRCDDCRWKLAVECAKKAPLRWNANLCCDFFDRVAPGKATNKDQSEWRQLNPSKFFTNSKMTIKGRDHQDMTSKPILRRSSGAGEPRQMAPPRSASRSNTTRVPASRIVKVTPKESTIANYTPALPTFRTTQGPVIKTLDDAKQFLMKTSLYGQQKEKQLDQSITVTPHYTYRSPNFQIDNSGTNVYRVMPSSYSTATRGPTQPQSRRRLGGLGRSPSPSPSPSPTRIMDQSRATNTTPLDKYIGKDSKSTLREALSRLKLAGTARHGSVGAASLGARRDAPHDTRAPSVRSDQRPLATQGDMLNSIKFQRRYRDTLNADKISAMFKEKVSLLSKEKPNVMDASSRINTCRVHNTDYSASKEQPFTSTSKFYGPPRPTSPKGRNRTSFY